MEFVKKTDDTQNFWKYWDILTTRLDAGPRYLRTTIEYYLEISEHRGRLVGDESVIFTQNSVPVAALFLPIEETDGVRSISFDLSYTLAPLFDRDQVRKDVMTYVDEVAFRVGVQKIMFGIDSLLSERYMTHFLLAHGYLNTSLLTYHIDLTLPGDLLRYCRRGHRSDIKTVLRDPNYEYFVVDADHPNYALHEDYRELHRIDAERVTRTKTSFDFQYKKLTDGNAALFGVRHHEKRLAYAYYEMSGGKAIYASAASDPSMTHLPLYHILMWNAMQYLRERGVHFIDVGQPSCPVAQFGYNPDQKMQNIARFKRGFGGRFVNDLRGVKYLDRALFLSETEKFKELYLADNSHLT